MDKNIIIADKLKEDIMKELEHPETLWQI